MISYIFVDVLFSLQLCNKNTNSRKDNTNMPVLISYDTHDFNAQLDSFRYIMFLLQNIPHPQEIAGLAITHHKIILII